MTSLDQNFSNSQHLFSENSKTASTYCSPNEANKEQLALFVDQEATVLKPRYWQCPHCNSEVATVSAGTGPHAGRFDCGGCGRFVRWLSKSLMAQIQGGVA